MNVVFDPDKDAANIEKHGVSFAEFTGFDGETITTVDDRSDYGETRYRTDWWKTSYDCVCHA
jgi:uncharacterized protein